MLTLCSCARLTYTSSSPLDVEIRNARKTAPDIGVERSSQAMHHYLMGQLSYLDDDFEKARKNFSVAGDLSANPEPELHIKLAELFIQSGDLEKAIRETGRALEVVPGNLNYLLLKAGALEALGKVSEAEENYASVLKSDPARLDTVLPLASLYVTAGRAPEAISALEAFTARRPAEPVGWYYLARVLENSKYDERAMEALKMAWQADPANFEMGLDLARLYLKIKRPEPAMSVCQQILMRDPAHKLAQALLAQLKAGPEKIEQAAEYLNSLESEEWQAGDARYKLALLDVQRQDARSAVTNLNLALTLQPGHENARYYLASVYAAAGRSDDAVAELFKISTESPMFVQSRMLASFVLRQNHKLEQAQAAIREVLDEDSGNKSAFAYLIVLLREAGKFREARDMLSDAIEDSPDDDRLVFQYAVVLHDLKQEDAALREMERVLILNPNHAEALNYLAYGLAMDKRDLGRAEELANRALKIRPEDGFFLDTLGWIYFNSGKLEEAEKTLAQAVSASGEDIVILDHYGDCLVALGRYEKAVKAWNAAVEKGLKSDSPEDKDTFKKVRRKLAELVKEHPELKRLVPKPWQESEQ